MAVDELLRSLLSSAEVDESMLPSRLFVGRDSLRKSAKILGCVVPDRGALLRPLAELYKR